MIIEDEEIKVSIRLMTYNHEPFISKAIESCLTQKTNFNFEIVIGDDFSTDNTREICEKFGYKYPSIINVLKRPIEGAYWRKRQELGRLYNFFNIIENCKGDYIALLDGDDYWTDPFKLQKQIDFLEKNKDFVICGTDSISFDEKTKKILKPSILNNNYNVEYKFNDLIEKNRFITNTVVFRKLPIVKVLPDWFYSAPFGDWPLFVLLTKYGKGINLSFTSGVYRVHELGIYSNSSDFNVNFNTTLVYKSFWYNFNKSKYILKPIQKWLLWSIYSSHNIKQKWKVFKVYIEIFRFRSFFQKSFYQIIKKILEPNNK